MTDDSDDSIGRALNIAPSTELTSRSSVVSDLMNACTDNSAVKDFEIARANLLTLIEGGKESFENLTKLAEQSQHPRAYEVLAKFLDSLVQANIEYLNLQSQIREITDPGKHIGNQNSQGPRTVNQTAIFVGSTSELQKAIKNSMKFINDEGSTTD
jgi:hypothetical protein